MKKNAFFLVLCLIGTTFASAQNDYIVSTPAQNRNSTMNEEELFIENNFPLETLCKWTPGMKFMFIPSAKDMFMPIFSVYENGKDMDNSKFKYKTFELTGIEEIAKEIYLGTNYSTRLVFECEGQKFYYEIKNQRLDDICQKNPRESINGLVYLKDVDIARQVLIGKVLYAKTTTVRVDDPNNYTGYREVSIPQNQKLIVKAVGVGSKAYPAKIVLEDPNGNSYFVEVALSRTNSGMDKGDFQADKQMKYFPNVFSFSDPAANTLNNLKSKYIDMPMYPKRTIPVSGNLQIESSAVDTRVHLLRYTPLHVKDIIIETPGTTGKLILEDANKRVYNVNVDLKYNSILKNSDYIEDLFAFGNIHKKYPNITNENWKLIAQGDVKAGMNTDECRLSLGEPIQVEIRKYTRFETWFYNRKVLEFENGILLRYK